MRHTGLYLAFGALLLVTAACGRNTPTPAPVLTPTLAPQATATAAEQPSELPASTPSPTSLPASPTPQSQPTEEVLRPEDLPPAGLVDVLAAKVERGEWTYEEGLIFYLKVMAGEIEASPTEREQPVSTEGTGIIFEAQRYLREGADPAVIQEIERLLGIIAPSSERLLEYAAPAPTSQNRPPGHAVPVRQDKPCTELWQEGFPSGSSIICLHYLTAYFGDTQATVYYPSTDQPPGFNVAFAQNALQAISDSVDTYSQYGDLKNVELVFTILADPDEVGTLAMVPNVGGAPTCNIIVYPLMMLFEQQYQASGFPPFSAFRQQIAHEMFHCFQVWNFPQQSDSPWAAADWWGDGTAEYFSNVVYPAVDSEHRWLYPFKVSSGTKSILELSYENFIFFQYLANRESNFAVLNLIKMMPTSGGTPEQTQALAGFPDIYNLFHDFGKDYLDGKILDASKQTLPTSPPGIPPGFTIPVGNINPTVANFESQPFTLTRYRLDYKPEAMYTQANESSGLDGRHATRHMSAAGSWGEFPELLPASCGDPSYYVLLTSTSPAEGYHQVKLTSNVKEELSCDECLVGTWDLYKPSFEAYMYDVMSHSEIFSINRVEGLWRWSFSKDGVFKSRYDQFNFDYSITQSGLQGNEIKTDVLLNINGPIDALYWTDGLGTLFATMTSSNFTIDQTAWINGDLVDQTSLGNLFDPNLAGSYIYACTPSQLSVVPPLSSNLYLEPLIYNKVSNAPLP